MVNLFTHAFPIGHFRLFELQNESLERAADLSGRYISPINDSSLFRLNRVCLLNHVGSMASRVVVRALVNSVGHVKVGPWLNRSFSGGFSCEWSWLAHFCNYYSAKTIPKSANAESATFWIYKLNWNLFNWLSADKTWENHSSLVFELAEVLLQIFLFFLVRRISVLFLLTDHWLNNFLNFGRQLPLVQLFLFLPFL